MNKTKLYVKVFALMGMLCFITNVNAKIKFKDSQEIWQEFYLYHPLSKKINISLLLNNMTDVNAGNVDRFIEPGIKYKFSSHFYAEAMYRKEYFRVGASWHTEDRPMVRVGWKSKLGPINFRNRHRMEFRFIENLPVRYRYRTDIKLSPQWSFSNWKLKPYIQEELFIQKQKMTKIRSYLGLQGTIKRWEPSVYALVQSYNLPDGYLNAWVFGICLAYRI
ncbi:MAG: DUF2490 domain-containing protein [Carboxylicivirga sp.]|jgi:hypothetical protein|nr:DUF2490 domain-containing protein [Carboxylicivirga sp.]